MLSQLPEAADTGLIWSVLMHDIAKPVTASRDDDGCIRLAMKTGTDMARAILNRLRFPNAEIGTVTSCVRYHMQLKDAREMRTATLRKLFLRSVFATELELHRLDCLSSSGRLIILNSCRQSSVSKSTGAAAAAARRQRPDCACKRPARVRGVVEGGA